MVKGPVALLALKPRRCIGIGCDTLWSTNKKNRQSFFSKNNFFFLQKLRNSPPMLNTLDHSFMPLFTPEPTTLLSAPHIFLLLKIAKFLKIDHFWRI
jgi:hypothetical protein